jgi:hypothetical protein
MRLCVHFLNMQITQSTLLVTDVVGVLVYLTFISIVSSINHRYNIFQNVFMVGGIILT